MKIGFSFGRCIRDIVNGTVAIEDVVCIIARTRIDAIEQIDGVVDAYMYRPDYFMGLDRDECITVARTLYMTGRIHQPRLFMNHISQMAENEIWMDLAPTTNSESEVVRKAWKAYQMAQKLAEESIPSHRYAGTQATRTLPVIDDNF